VIRDVGERGSKKKVAFQEVEAVEGTWLSAAARDLGWDAHYSKEDGYGAYNHLRGGKPIVFTWDLSPVDEPDTVWPGDSFLVKLPPESQEVPGVKEVVPEVAEGVPEEETDFEDVVEEGLKIGQKAATVGQILAAFGAISAGATAIAFIAGWFLTVIVFWMQAAEAHNANERRAALRARCYAFTSALFDNAKHIGLSKVFTTLYSESVSCGEAWETAWKESMPAVKMQLNSWHMDVNKHLKEQGLGPPTREEFLMALTEGKTSAEFCEDLMLSDEVVSTLHGWVMRDTTAENYWRKNAARVKYPD
jgi:hypothetical protein